MKTIPLTLGKVAVVDDEDYDIVSQYRWYAAKGNATFYAQRHCKGRNGKQQTVTMHRLLMAMEKGDRQDIDHINHDGLDNRRCNLRVCTRSQNNQNQRKRRGVSRFKGVSLCRKDGKWQALIAHNHHRIHLGRFATEIDAALAYDATAYKLFEQYACTNF